MMRLTLDKQITITGLTPLIQNQIKQALTIKNPAYLEAIKHNRWTGGTDKILVFYKELVPGPGLSLPRGFTRQALNIIGKDLVFRDNRRVLPEIDFQFTGKLRPYQEDALQDVLKKDFGVLEALTGSGKTIIALAAIAARNQPTLILVHTKELLHQWRDRIAEFMSVDAGLVGDGKFDIQPTTVAIINTAKNRLTELPEHFGQIIVDEVHRTPSTMFSEVVQAFDCKYMLGLSATPYRRDGLTSLIHWFAGPLVHKIDSKELQDLGAVLVPEIIHKQTDFHYNFRDDYTKMLSVLTQDETRNAQIAQDILKEATTRTGTVLVVSDRIKHCLALADLLLSSGVSLNVKILTSQLKSKERAALVEDIKSGAVDVVIATLALISEGFDCPGLSSLFFGTPIKFGGRTIQTIGRILRPADGKTARVFDYRDPCGVLIASAKTRMKTYREMNWIVGGAS